MFVMNWALVVEGIPLVAPIVTIQLNNLQHNKFVAKSQALSTLVQGASLFVSDLEDHLQGVTPGSGTEADVISAAVSSLKTLYAGAVAKLNLPPAEVDNFLQMLLQQVRLPNGAQNIVSQFTGAVTEVPGGSTLGNILRRNKPVALMGTKLRVI